MTSLPQHSSHFLVKNINSTNTYIIIARQWSTHARFTLNTPAERRYSALVFAGRPDLTDMNTKGWDGSYIQQLQYMYTVTMARIVADHASLLV